MKLHIFSWNIRKELGKENLLNLIADYAKTLDGEFLAWVCEIPKDMQDTYGDLTVHWPYKESDKKYLQRYNAGVFLASQGIEKIDTADFGDEVDGKAYSALFRVENTIFPVTGIHLHSQMHPTRGHDEGIRLAEVVTKVGRIKDRWLRPLVKDDEFHKWYFSHIIMGDFNTRPDSKALYDHTGLAGCDDLQRVVRQRKGVHSHTKFLLRYNPSIRWSGSPTASYFYEDGPVLHWNNYDQIMLAPNAADLYINNSFELLDCINGKSISKLFEKSNGEKYTIPDKDEFSDHFPIKLQLEVENDD